MFSDARVTLWLSLLKSSNAVVKASSPRSHPSACIMTLRSDSNLFECHRSELKDWYPCPDINFSISSKQFVLFSPILPIFVKLYLLLIISRCSLLKQWQNICSYMSFTVLNSSVIYSPQRQGIWAAPLMTACAAGSETKTATCTGRRRPTRQVIEGQQPSVYPTYQHAQRLRRKNNPQRALVPLSSSSSF